MKQVHYFLLVLSCFLMIATTLSAQQEVMIITTVEYMDFIDGSNSQMYITRSSGATENIQLRGLFAVGQYISEKKIKANDKTVVDKLSEFIRAGWEIMAVSSSTQPKQATQNSAPSSIVTRYVLVKKS